MPKMRLRLVLPTVQVLAAATLLHFGGRYETPFPLGPQMRDVCWGLNAPAVPFQAVGRWLAYTFTWLRGSLLLHLGVDDLFFLGGVAIVWYLVGRILDGRRTVPPRAKTRRLTVFLICPILLLLGIGFASHALHDLGPRRIRELDPPIGGVLTLLWGGVLIALAGAKLIMVFRSQLALLVGAKHKPS